MSTIADTTEFSLDIGVNPGFFHDNAVKDPLKVVADLWQKFAEEIFKDCNVYVAAVICPTKTVYNTAWGCPAGGEDTITIHGVRNPEFTPNEDVWKVTVGRVAIRLAKELQQSTAYLVFRKVELLYLKASA
jgi:hypothetical protein